MKENQLNSLPLYYDKKTNEANILDYNKEKIIKYFHLINENKVYTLKEIEKEKDLKIIKELLVFKKLVVVHSEIKGILLDKGYDINLEHYKDENADFNALITILQNVGKVLQQLEEIRKQEGKLQNFFIGDLHEGNILVDKKTKRIQICDIDSCKIANNIPFLTKYSFLRAHYYVFQYLKRKYHFYNPNIPIPNTNFDLYSYIAIIFNTLFQINIQTLTVTDYFKILYSLKREGLPEPLFQIFLKIYNQIDNENPYKYLDSIPTTFERKLNL